MSAEPSLFIMAWCCPWCVVLSEFVEQRKQAWNHVLHGQGSSGEIIEVGAELALGAVAPLVWRSLRGPVAEGLLPKLPVSAEAVEATPFQLFQKAEAVLARGNKIEAAALYDRATYYPQAIRLYTELGHYQSAYGVARRSGDHFIADALAAKHNIAGHEFSNIPSSATRNYFEASRLALQSRLGPGATAEQLGFAGFKDKVLADIGARDGRYLPLWRSLGAREVYAVDPSAGELSQAVRSGLIDEKHVLATRLQDLPPALVGHFDVATVFNFMMPVAERPAFASSLHGALKEGGQVVLTFAEKSTMEDTLPVLSPYFRLSTRKLWNVDGDAPHAYLTVGTRVRGEALTGRPGEPL